MNLLGLLVGAKAVKSLTGYPSEIRNLRKQMPKAEREAFLKDYKKLSPEAKTQFKDYLRQADMKAAGALIDRDLSAYKTVRKEAANTSVAEPESTEEAGSDIVSRVNRILAVPTDIDPVLLAEARRRYEEAVPAKDKTLAARKNSGIDYSR